MANHFVRKTGNDGNGGHSADDAWLTIGKALGAAGFASGDTVYIGAGTYREVVAVAMTSATAETKVIGDVDGAMTGDAGPVIWTAFTTNDTTAPSASVLLDLAGRDYLTFEHLILIGGGGITVSGVTATATYITFRDCAIYGSFTSASINTIRATFGYGLVAHWLFERCIITSHYYPIYIVLTTGVGSDWDCDFVVRNCVIHTTITGARVESGGTAANHGGGLKIYNSTIYGTRDSYAVYISDVYGSTTYPISVYNCVIVGGLYAGLSGEIVENYNCIYATAPHTNVSVGGNTTTNTYSALFSLAHEPFVVGSQLRPWMEPMAGSPWLGFGNDGTYTSAEDIRGTIRPAGGSATKGIGAYERGNTGAKETTTKRTGTNAVKIAGPGWHDFQLPVAAASTTVTVYGRYDASYTGTLPQMAVVNGEECGVAAASDTMVAAADTWEQLSLNFTPTAAGIVTIRLISNSTATAGNAYFDDFDVA